jgi:hypothetical protein
MEHPPMVGSPDYPCRRRKFKGNIQKKCPHWAKRGIVVFLDSILGFQTYFLAGSFGAKGLLESAPMTEEMPITMPKQVRPERIRCRHIDRTASRQVW